MTIHGVILRISLFAASVTSLGSGSLHKRTTLGSNNLWRRDIDPSTLYPEHNISVPVDYFHNETKYEPHSNGTFPLRYWFDASYYKDGGPVIVLQSGETDGEGRLPFLQKGLLHQLAQATNGIGVVLEHRYYGKSFPTPDLSTPNLRFLTTEQALADMAYFAQNVVFEGLEDKNLTAPETAYFGYGGSYAGAFGSYPPPVSPKPSGISGNTTNPSANTAHPTASPPTPNSSTSSTTSSSTTPPTRPS
ncbi:MAG: hypothetical protein Q9207_008537 [Kuettlingeria erythrocarpa]